MYATKNAAPHPGRALAPVAEAGAYAAVFAWSAIGAVPVALTAWWGRRRWVRTR